MTLLVVFVVQEDAKKHYSRSVCDVFMLYAVYVIQVCSPIALSCLIGNRSLAATKYVSFAKKYINDR